MSDAVVLASNGNTSAKFLSAQTSPSTIKPGVYVYRQTLDLSCYALSTVSIGGNVLVDNSVEVYVNGKPVLTSFGGMSQDTAFALSGYGFTQHLVKGLNEIDFLVTNSGGSDSASGIRIAITTASGTPETTNPSLALSLTADGGNRSSSTSVAINASESVSWVIDGSHTGNLNGTNGATATYTSGPSLSSFTIVTVKAASTANAAKLAYKTLYFNPDPNAAIQVSASPAGTQNMNAGRTLSFTGTVTGALSNSNLVWTASPGGFANGNTANGATNVYSAPLSVASDASVTAQVCSAQSTSTCQAIPIALKAITVSYVSPNTSQLDYNSSRSFTVNLAGLLTGSSNTLLLSADPVSGITQSFPGSVTVDSVGNATFSYSALCSTSCPVVANIKLTATSQQDTSRRQWVEFQARPSAGTQSISAVLNPSSGSYKTTLTVTVSDTSGHENIGSVVVNLSNTLTINGYPPGAACQILYYKLDPGRVSVDDNSGSSTWPTNVYIGASGNVAGSASCEIDGVNSSITKSGTQLLLTLALRNVTITGTRYVWGKTGAPQNGSIAAPFQYLGSLWTPDAVPLITITNSQNVAIPALSSSYSLVLRATVQNSTNHITFTNVQPDGTLTNAGTPDAGYRGQATYTAHNGGENRTVKVRATLDGFPEISRDQEIQIVSQASQPPKLNFLNPFTGNSNNPSSINTSVIANGTASLVHAFGVDNTAWPAAYCGVVNGNYVCYPINELYLNINRTESEGASAQDTAGGCRIAVRPYAGSQPPTYVISLTNDAGTGDVYPNAYWVASTNGGATSISNAQCTVYADTVQNSYAQPNGGAQGSILGLGLRIVFKPTFQGQRHVYMMGRRSGGDWSGWSHRGTIQLVP